MIDLGVKLGRKKNILQEKSIYNSKIKIKKIKSEINLIKAPKKSDIKKWGLNVKLRTKGVNNIYWLKGKLNLKNQIFHKRIKDKNSKSKERWSNLKSNKIRGKLTFQC